MNEIQKAEKDFTDSILACTLFLDKQEHIKLEAIKELLIDTVEKVIHEDYPTVSKSWDNEQ